MQKVKFSCGRTETVYVVPVLAIEDLDQLPEYKVGETDTAEQAAAKLQALAQRKADTYYLAGFADAEIPDDWQFPDWALAQGLQPREGETGRKLDFIRYELLRKADDVIMAQAAMQGEVAPEEVAAAEKKFRFSDIARRLFTPKRRR